VIKDDSYVIEAQIITGLNRQDTE